MPSFDPPAMLADFDEFKTIFQNFADAVPADAWSLKTGERDKDWTMHETLAHLVSVARLFNMAAEYALSETSFDVQDFTERAFLGTWNKREIAELSQKAPADLVAQLVAELSNTQKIIPRLTEDNFTNLADLPVYNRPSRALELVDWQLSHAGIIHAAQITRPLKQPPLWEHYSDAMTHRQIDRFVRHFSYAYWQELGPQERHVINLEILGETGGNWHLVGDADGGDFGQGLVEDASYHAQFATPQTFFGVFTFHIPFLQAIQSKQIQFKSDMRATMEILRLFSATPPKL